MLTGSVVGDGNLAAWTALFEGRSEIVFCGTLLSAGSPVPVTYHFLAPEMDAATPARIECAREELGWEGETIACCSAHCSISCPVAELSMVREPMLASLDIHTDGSLRLLMLSDAKPQLGYAVCLLDARSEPAQLAGGDEMWWPPAEPIITCSLSAVAPLRLAPTASRPHLSLPSPAAEALDAVEVAVPAGLGPGDSFEAEVGGRLLRVGVPDGVGAGDLLLVTPPAATAAAEVGTAGGMAGVVQAAAHGGLGGVLGGVLGNALGGRDGGCSDSLERLMASLAGGLAAEAASAAAADGAATGASWLGDEETAGSIGAASGAGAATAESASSSSLSLAAGSCFSGHLRHPILGESFACRRVTACVATCVAACVATCVAACVATCAAACVAACV